MRLNVGHADLLSEFSDALSGADSIPCSFWGIDRDSARQWIEEQDREIVLGIVDSMVACVGALRIGGRHQEHLGEVSVAVHPDHRRKGLAKLMTAELEKRAAAQKVEILKALIWIENRPSRELFESLGYEHRATLMAEFKSDEIGEIDDAVYYKRLKT